MSTPYHSLLSDRISSRRTILWARTNDCAYPILVPPGMSELHAIAIPVKSVHCKSVKCESLKGFIELLKSSCKLLSTQPPSTCGLLGVFSVPCYFGHLSSWEKYVFGHHLDIHHVGRGGSALRHLLLPGNPHKEGLACRMVGGVYDL